MKLKLAAVLATALVVSSCTTTDVDLGKSWQQVCRALDTAHATFQAAALSGAISERTIEREERAYETVLELCATEPVNTADAIIRITAATATIVRYYKEIR